MVFVLRRLPASRVFAAAVGLIAIAIVAAVFLVLDDVPATIPALLLLVPIALSSALSGWRIAVPIAIVAAGVFALAFLPPVGSIRIALAEDVFVLGAFIFVAVMVGALTDSRRSASDNAMLDEGRAVLLRGVSHDLRNPLHTIRTVSSDLLDESITHDDATRAQLLGLVVRETDRLDRIVGNLLSVSQVDAGALLPRLVSESVDDLVFRCVGRFNRLGIENVATDIEPDLPDVIADAVQIDQVLTNLIENALRYAPPGSDVVVEARAAGQYVEIAVADSGPGFSDAARANAGRPLPRSAVRSAGSNSTGLGLTVCTAIVKAHAGTIAVRDATTHGARVSFTLPIET